MKIKDILNPKNILFYIPFFISIIIILGYLSPFIILGQDAHILIHDNLDSAFVLKKILSSSGEAFGSFDINIPNLINGIPRNSLGSEFDFYLLLLFLFKPYKAYLINLILIHFIAFFGMYLLLTRHFIKDNFIILGVSVCFAILPFWPSGMLSVAGLPLTLYSFLNIRSNNFKFWDWLILFFIPFYSSFITSYIFLLFLLFLLWAIDYIRNKKCNYRFMISIIFTSVIFFIIEYRLIYEMFLSQEYISHRTEFIPTYYSIIESLKIALENFIYGQYHAQSLHQYFVCISILLAIVVLFVKKQKINKTDKNYKILLLLLSISLLFSFWYGFFNCECMLIIKGKIKLFNYFNMTRFHWLHPLLWYIAFALALIIIKKYLKFGKFIIAFILILQIMFLFYNNSEFVERRKGLPTYREFFAEELFNEVKEYIGFEQENYRVVNIGLHPSIAQYNGFYTLDGYFVNYPLSYKHRFRNIIEKELNKNTEIRDYFDNWGSRCYIFVDELGKNYIFTKKTNKKIENLEINTDALKKLGGEYIISAIEIVNYNENNLKFLKVFKDNNSAWDIYLYKIY
jgi:hypothetical protein